MAAVRPCDGVVAISDEELPVALEEAIDREYLLFSEHDARTAAGYIREKDGKRYVEPVA